MSYYAAPDDWQTRTPDESGLDAKGLAAAVRCHLAHESPWPCDFLVASGRDIGVADEPPGPDEVLGLVRADTTLSVAKASLAVLAGLAVG